MKSRRAPNAYSLLEVALASSLCVGALVPALSMVRDGVSLADTIDTRHMLLVCGVSKMEEQVAVVAASWTSGSLSGNFAADGHPNIRFTVSRSDSAANGGIANRLMNVAVTTYSDENGNSVMDASEMRTTLTTKISKLASYESQAGS